MMDRPIMVVLLRIISLAVCLEVSAQRLPIQRGFLPGNSVSTGNGLSTGLLGHYALNEGSGNALDDSGAGLNLTASTSIPSAAGKLNTSRQPNAGSYFSYVDNDAFEMRSRDYSISFWFYYAGGLGSGEQKILLCKAESGTAGKQTYFIDIFDNGSTQFFEFGVSEDGTYYSLNYCQIEKALSTGWYFICARVDHTNLQYKLDIRKDDDAVWFTDSDTYGGSISNNDSILTLGGILDSFSAPRYTAPANSRIDELAFWSTFLSDCQRDKLFNSGSALAKGSFNTSPCN